MIKNQTKSYQDLSSITEEQLSASNIKDIKESDFFIPIDAAERWEKNVKRLNALVTLEGAKYYLFLQPTLGLEGIQSQPKPGTYDEELYKITADRGFRKKIRSLYTELKVRCSNLDFCYDISDKAPPSGSVYYDPRHHNAIGNKVIASEIWKIIKLYEFTNN